MESFWFVSCKHIRFGIREIMPAGWSTTFLHSKCFLINKEMKSKACSIHSPNESRKGALRKSTVDSVWRGGGTGHPLTLCSLAKPQSALGRAIQRNMSNILSYWRSQLLHGCPWHAWIATDRYGTWASLSDAVYGNECDKPWVLAQEITSLKGSGGFLDGIYLWEIMGSGKMGAVGWVWGFLC